MPSFLVISRTMRFIFLKVPSNGTIRSAITLSCSSPFILCSCRAALAKLSSSKPAISGFWVTMASAITISPTKSINLSSLSTRTVIIWAPSVDGLGCGFCRTGPATPAGKSGLIGSEFSNAVMAMVSCDGQYSHSAVLASSFSSI